MSEYAKPLPRGEDLHGEFYELCGNHRLSFQRCVECDTWRHMPRETCAQCGSFEWNWRASSGKGTLFSWTVVHRAIHPGFAEDVPYASVIVEMDEGVRLVSRLEDVPLDELKLGLPLEVVYKDVAPDVTLHAFRLASDGSSS